MTDEVMEGQVSLFDQDSQFMKMFLEPSVPTKAETSKPSSTRSSKSQSQTLPLCLCLKSGATADASTMRWEDGQLLGEYTMDSFGEKPCMLTEEESYPALPNGVEGSRLSQILVDDAPQKYFLSAKAVVGIIRRATKRGKELPKELRMALQNQSGYMENNYGETEIRNAGEILREMWEEVGAETFVEWVHRADVLVSEETLLLCGVCEQDENGRDISTTCAYSKTEPSKSEECNPKCPMRYLWERWLHRSTPHRQEPNEQLAGQLGAFVQKLSRQTTQAEIFMRCVRSACEGSSAMQQALASMEKEQSERLGYSIYADDKANT